MAIAARARRLRPELLAASRAIAIVLAVVAVLSMLAPTSFSVASRTGLPEGWASFDDFTQTPPQGEDPGGGEMR
jgi:hypothetical protein